MNRPEHIRYFRGEWQQYKKVDRRKLLITQKTSHREGGE